MKQIAGILIMVDAVALMKDYGLFAMTKTGKQNEKIPVFNLDKNASSEPYIRMVTESSFVNSGIGTQNMSLKARPGDEIRWWTTNISKYNEIEVRISKVTPLNYESYWDTWLEYYPTLLTGLLHEEAEASIKKGKKLFWSANYIERKFHTKIKEKIYSSSEEVTLPYQIDIQILSPSNISQEGSHLCTFRWGAEIIIQNQITSNNIETLKHPVAAGLVDRNLFLIN